MLKLKVNYWDEFKKYQSFETVESMFNFVSVIESRYDLTNATKSVLNTIKLHAKTFAGVCWMKIAEIAKKAKVSVKSVQRAIELLKDAGVLVVISQTNTKRGGKAPNVYVINPNFQHASSFDASNDQSNVQTDDLLENDVEDAETPTATSDLRDSVLSYKNSHSDSNSNLNKNSNTKESKVIDENNDKYETLSNSIKLDLSEINQSQNLLKGVPTEFITIFRPFYTDDSIIKARWKSTCVAVKKACIPWEHVSFGDIKDAWKDTINKYKTKQIRNSSDDGIGGYYYKTLCNLLSWSYAELVLSGELLNEDCLRTAV